MPDPIPPPQPISVPIVEPTYSNPISHYAGIVEDPNMDNSSMYRDEYADYTGPMRRLVMPHNMAP